MDVMLDLETFGKRAGCAVVSIGACTFLRDRQQTHNDQSTFHAFLSLPEQLSAGVGMEMDAETVLWWMEQSAEAQKAITQGQKCAQHPSRVLLDFAQWYQGVGGIAIWGNGSDFDLPILGALYAAYGMPVPWKYNAGRCCRTIMDLTSKKMGAFGSVNTLAHDALSDAIYQASEISAAMRHLSTVGV